MKVLVVGPKGMLGSAVMYALDAAGYDAEPCTERMELVGWSQLMGRPVVINCAGVVPQKGISDSKMIMANAYGPHRLAELMHANGEGARLIHVSTDCVFSKVGPHVEYENVSPKSLYGFAKATGEVSAPPHLTVRTSFIGTARHGLVWDMWTKKEIKASDQLHWNGHTAMTVARALVALIPTSLTGLIHFPGEHQTRLSLVRRLRESFGLTHLDVVEDNNFRQDRRLGTVRKGFDFKFPSFDEQLAELVPAWKEWWECEPPLLP